MKHYPHHIGDFDKATRHLTRIERSVYRDLLDLYYDTEKPLTLDIEALCRRIVARSNEESTAVQQVLNEFFTETPTGWYHDRCEEEIAAYHANTSQKALAGKASAEAKRRKRQQALNGESTSVEHPLNSVATEAQRNSTNHQPINQSTNSSEAIASGAVAPAMTSAEQVWILGVPQLTAKGTADKQARSFLGGLVKKHGADAVVDALQACARASPVEPIAWLTASLSSSRAPPKAAPWDEARAKTIAALRGENRAPAKPAQEVFDVIATRVD